MYVFLLILGCGLILWGADRLTEGASSLARRMGMSEMVVGLTVVSFGTSLPEFVVSLFGTLTNASDISVGNIVGSNLFNTLMIVGCSALACPIVVSKSTVHRDIPFVLLSTAMLVVMSLDDSLGCMDGVLLLLAFVVFMCYTFFCSPSVDNTADENVAPLWLSMLWCMVGLVCLVFGGQMFVDNATKIALELGVSEFVVGMTIAAAGTSLPELATSVVAALKGHSAMAVGNVIGSNVFNILFVMGVCAGIAPLNVADLSVVNLAILIGSAVLFWLFARSKYVIERWEGAILAVGYVSYIIYVLI